MALGSAEQLAGQAVTYRAPSGGGFGGGMGGGRTMEYTPRYGRGGPSDTYGNPNAAPPPTPYQRYLDQYTRQNAPDLQNFQTQGQLGANRLDLTLAQQALSGGGMRQQFGFDMRGLGLDRQALGLSANAARRGLGFTRQEEAIMRQQLANSQNQAQAAAGSQVWDTRSEATASGAMTAPGLRHDLAETYGNLFLTRESNQLGFDRDLLGLRERRGSLRDQLRNTRLEAQRLGLREDELRAGLRSGLRQLRLDTSLSINDILSGLSSNNASQAALYRQILEQALRASRG